MIGNIRFTVGKSLDLNARHLSLFFSKYFVRRKSHHSHKANFGILFDIDGVIVRGKEVLPFSPEAFKKLVDDSGKFRVPTVFVTNAGNSLRQTKADKLTEWLGVEVNENQIVMSHSPLRMLTESHDKHVLVSGQGPVDAIARNLGFKRVTTMEQFRLAFPTLDAVDHNRRRLTPDSFESNFPPIETIVLFGEPIRWETSLQLIIDVLVTDGLPISSPHSIKYPHLPILACNMDLLWMAEACMPRFGHGAFLLCLENLYQKITNRELIYTSLVGKPSEITYLHSDHVLQQEAGRLGIATPIKHIYCVGDNVCTDILGANLYNSYLKSGSKSTSLSGSRFMRNSICNELHEMNGNTLKYNAGLCVEHCYSVLVETGVYSAKSPKQHTSLNHSPRDFLPLEEGLEHPDFTVSNVLEAVNLIYKRENFI